MSAASVTTTTCPAPLPLKEDEEFVEDVVCQDSDVKEKQIKVVDLKDAGKVLLVRHKGVLRALGTKCTHYGAPLSGSALGDGRLRCQWHGACFNIATGDIEDFPGTISYCNAFLQSIKLSVFIYDMRDYFFWFF